MEIKWGGMEYIQYIDISMELVVWRLGGEGY
jgi:hypothetical protein